MLETDYDTSTVLHSLTTALVEYLQKLIEEEKWRIREDGEKLEVERVI